MSFPEESRRAYRADKQMRARIFEFFGEVVHDLRPAVHPAVDTEQGSRPRHALSVEKLSSWMNRWLWDCDSLICHLDIEYVNFDDHAYPFLNQERVFALQFAGHGKPTQIFDGAQRARQLLRRTVRHLAMKAQLPIA